MASDSANSFVTSRASPGNLAEEANCSYGAASSMTASAATDVVAMVAGAVLYSSSFARNPNSSERMDLIAHLAFADAMEGRHL